MDAPAGEQVPQDLAAILTELRQLREEMRGNVERAARLEKRLRLVIEGVPQ